MAKHPLRDPYTFLLTRVACDPTYGVTPEHPVQVGGVDKNEGPLNQRRYLNALYGPQGQPISYRRVGSCCPFKTRQGFLGQGLLDVYLLTWEGQREPIRLYLNMYDYGQELMAPPGFSLKPQPPTGSNRD